MALEDLFLSTGADLLTSSKPQNLTLVYAASPGRRPDGASITSGTRAFSSAWSAAWGLVPKVQQLAIGNKIEAYNLPQGVISHLFRDIAAHRPGHLTRVGWVPSSIKGSAAARSMRGRPKIWSSCFPSEDEILVLQGASDHRRDYPGTTADPEEYHNGAET